MPDDDNICFVFGDVLGKGVPGALIMCRLAGAASALLTVEKDAARILTAINHNLCDRMPSVRFVTLAFLNIHLPTKRFAFANAGHMLPMHRKAQGDVEYIG